MITIPSLSEESFKDILEFARYHYGLYYPEKIDMSYQDPTQTILEMFSLLIDMQRYYMGFIGEEHYKQYASLLGFMKQHDTLDTRGVLGTKDTKSTENINGTKDTEGINDTRNTEYTRSTKGTRDAEYARSTKDTRNTEYARSTKDTRDTMDIVAKIPLKLQKIHKAVTIDDYRTILSRMVSIKIDRMNIVSKGNTILIYVKPKSNDFLPCINREEINQIRLFLEPYRIITTKIVIDKVRYIPINISMKVSFNPEWKDCEERTKERIAEIFPCSYFQNDVVRSFGEKIFYGEIFVLIGSMPWITVIEELKINDSKDDISLKENELAYINEIKFAGLSESCSAFL